MTKIEQFKTLDFLTYIPGGWFHVFRVNETGYIMEIYEPDLNQMFWWEKVSSKEFDEQMVKFPKVFNSLPPNIQEKFIYYLDLFIQ